MKLIWPIMAAVLCSVWAVVLVTTERWPKYNFPADPSASSLNQLGNISLRTSGGNGHLVASAGVTRNQGWLNLPTDKPSRPAVNPPGIYRSTPYLCLIFLPGPQPDQQAVQNPPINGLEKMPAIIPGLKLTPWPPDKK